MVCARARVVPIRRARYKQKIVRFSYEWPQQCSHWAYICHGGTSVCQSFLTGYLYRQEQSRSSVECAGPRVLHSAILCVMYHSDQGKAAWDGERSWGFLIKEPRTWMSVMESQTLLVKGPTVLPSLMMVISCARTCRGGGMMYMVRRHRDRCKRSRRTYVPCLDKGLLWLDIRPLLCLHRTRPTTVIIVTTTTHSPSSWL